MSFVSRFARCRTANVLSRPAVWQRSVIVPQVTRGIASRSPEDPDVNPITGNKISADADPKNLGAFVRPFFNQPAATEVGQQDEQQQMPVQAKPPDVEEQRMQTTGTGPAGPTGGAPYMGGPPRAQQPHQTDMPSPQGHVETAGADAPRKKGAHSGGHGTKHKHDRAAGGTGTAAMAGTVATGMASAGPESPPSVNTGTTMAGHKYSVEELEVGTEPADTPFAPVE